MGKSRTDDPIRKTFATRGTYKYETSVQRANTSAHYTHTFALHIQRWEQTPKCIQCEDGAPSPPMCGWDPHLILPSIMPIFYGWQSAASLLVSQDCSFIPVIQTSPVVLRLWVTVLRSLNHNRGNLRVVNRPHCLEIWYYNRLKAKSYKFKRFESTWFSAVSCTMHFRFICHAQIVSDHTQAS